MKRRYQWVNVYKGFKLHGMLKSLQHLQDSFIEAAKKRVLLFDGAMGTEIQRLNPKRAAELAKDVCDEFKESKPRYIIGSMGPSGYLPSSNDPALGETPLDEIQEAFALQAEGLILGGVDALLIETSQDILEVKLAIEACHEAMEKVARKVSIIANVTLDQYGKMLLGTNIQAAYTAVSNMNIDAFGLNCSTGPHEMVPSVRWLSEQELPILVMPNAGMPQNEGGRAVYKMTPKEIAEALKDFVNKYDHVRMIGGCCGTNPQHITELRRVLDANNKKKY